MNIHLEYIWLDGNYPQRIRSKTKIVKDKIVKEKGFGNPIKNFDISNIPVWNFDGSSTNQAETSKSELLLNPVSMFNDPFKKNGYIVMCEVMNIDMTPHKTNKRNKMVNTINKYNQDILVGLEQEYFIYDRKTNKPLGWPTDGFPRPQGPYYCGVGGNNIVGREFVEEHANLCEMADLQISGINAEVALGQWEYQIGPVPAINGSDQLWVSRYLLERLSEKYDYYIVLDPKPFVGNDWNGSGMHVNLSTREMREDIKNKKEIVIDACIKIGEKIEEHMVVYGPNNDLRLTGHNETCSINEFRYGIGDRTASIRIPSSINDDISQGYFEDRRPASNGDPYEIINVISKTICSKKKESNLV